MPGTTGVRSRHRRASQTLTSSRAGTDAVSTAGAGRRPRRHARYHGKEGKSHCGTRKDRAQRRVGPGLALGGGRDLFVLALLAALVSRYRALPAAAGVMVRSAPDARARPKGRPTPDSS